MLLFLPLLFLVLSPVSSQQQQPSSPFKSRPDLIPAPWNITFQNSSSDSLLSSEGFIFLAPRVTEPTGLMIFSNSGDLIYLDDSSSFQGAFDFRPQTWNGQTYLTFWAGEASTAGFGMGRVYLLDNGYEVVKNVTAPGTSDFHEFHINEDGTAVTTVYTLRSSIDTSAKSLGQSSSFVWDGCLVEFDLSSSDSNSNPSSEDPLTSSSKFSWCSLESPITILDSFTDPATPPTDANNGWDYFHINSAEKDKAGNYLVSARHTHSVYYIDGSTKQILWTLGSASSTNPSTSLPSNFTGDGNEFSWQHDARWVGEKNVTADDIRSANSGNTSGPLAGKRRLTLYDNASAGFSNSGTESRGLLIELDFTQSPWTATIITSFHSPGGETNLLSASQGNVQMISEHPELGDTNVFMGYGSVPVFAEYTSEGDPIRVVHYGISPNAQSYRIFRGVWDGTPTTRPDVVIDNSTGTVFVSWNGATRVTKWRVQQGADSNSLGNSTDVDKSGFETSILLDTSTSTSSNGQVVQLSALDKDGNVLAKSNVMSIADGSKVAEGVDGVKVNGTNSGSGTSRGGSGGGSGSGDDSNGAGTLGSRLEGTMTATLLVGWVTITIMSSFFF